LRANISASGSIDPGEHENVPSFGVEQRVERHLS
jgi:hypothetical protein